MSTPKIKTMFSFFVLKTWFLFLVLTLEVETISHYNLFNNNHHRASTTTIVLMLVVVQRGDNEEEKESYEI
jgi:Trk-type K+ transport system membrane component